MELAEDGGEELVGEAGSDASEEVVIPGAKRVLWTEARRIPGKAAEGSGIWRADGRSGEDAVTVRASARREAGDERMLGARPESCAGAGIISSVLAKRFTEQEIRSAVQYDHAKTRGGTNAVGIRALSPVGWIIVCLADGCAEDNASHLQGTESRAQIAA